MTGLIYTRSAEFTLNDENVTDCILITACNALKEKSSGFRTLVILNGDSGISHRIEMDITDERDHSDMALLTWFMSFSYAVRSMLSVTLVNGRRKNDPLQVNRKYLVVSVCLREKENIRNWASMTELPILGSDAVPVPETPMLLPENTVEQAGDGPSLYSLPRSFMTLKERVEARSRVESALKRAAHGKRLFTDAMHARIGWN